jgi:hypothetical protein
MSDFAVQALGPPPPLQSVPEIVEGMVKIGYQLVGSGVFGTGPTFHGSDIAAKSWHYAGTSWK